MDALDDDTIDLRIKLLCRCNRLGRTQHVHGIDETVQFALLNRFKTSIVRGGGYGIVEDFLGKALLRRHKRPDTAAQLAILLDRNECARTALRKFLRQFCGKRQIGMCPHKVFDTPACKPHIGVLCRTQLCHRRILRTYKLRRVVFALIPPCDGERGDGIAHAERTFIAVQPVRERCTVKGTREHPQAVQPTVPRRLGKAAGNPQEREKIPRL